MEWGKHGNFVIYKREGWERAEALIRSHGITEIMVEDPEKNEQFPILAMTWLSDGQEWQFCTIRTLEVFLEYPLM